jgi:hypothetical protein
VTSKIRRKPGIRILCLPAHVDLFRCESILRQSYWVMVVMDILTRWIIGFGVAANSAATRTGESCRLSAVVLLAIQSQTFTHNAGENAATASFRPPPQLELYFATHRTRWRRKRDPNSRSCFASAD